MTSGNCISKGNSAIHYNMCLQKLLVSFIDDDPCRYVHAAFAINSIANVEHFCTVTFSISDANRAWVSCASGTSGVIVSGTPFYSGDDGGAISLVGIFRRGKTTVVLFP